MLAGASLQCYCCPAAGAPQVIGPPVCSLQQRRQRMARHRMFSISPESTPLTMNQQVPTAERRREPDAYVAASLRLQGMIECVG